MYSVCRIGHLAVALLWLVAPIAVPASTLPETYGGHQAQLPLIFKEHPHHHHQPQEFPDISSSSITTKDDDVAAIVPADHGAVSSSPSALYTASYDEQQVVRIDISSLPGRQVENLLEELEVGVSVTHFRFASHGRNKLTASTFPPILVSGFRSLATQEE